MIRRLTAWLLCTILLAGCADHASGGRSSQEAASTTGQTLSQYETTFFSLFDTTTTVKGYAKSEEDFRLVADRLEEELSYYHRLFDIYNDYEGVVNIKTVNDNAGIRAVGADDDLITFLKFCRDVYEMTDGTVDVTLGPVLYLWHVEREYGSIHPEDPHLPDDDALAEAMTHTGFDLVVIDEASKTVYLTDAQARLDVGALAKGYAVGCVAKTLPSGYLISVGGNVAATGAKADGSPWIVGVRNPEEDRNSFLHTLYITDMSVVSSGDYERYYTVDGVRYCHIIDRNTLYPATHWRGVSVIHEDSGLADALSTAAFLMELDPAKALLKRYGAEGVFADENGSLYYTDGFAAYIRT